MTDNTAESKLDARLRKIVLAMGGSCIKFEAEKGMPDRVITLPPPDNSTFFVELKRDKGRLSRIQEVCIQVMRRRGAEVAVMYGEAGLKELTDELTARADLKPWLSHRFHPKYSYCRADHPKRDDRRHTWSTDRKGDFEK